MPFRRPHTFREFSEVCEGSRTWLVVSSVWVQAAVWLGILWAPPSGSRHSPAPAVRLTDRGL
eukprot:1033472-Prorocentrum_minimum.AAC.1